MYGFDKSGIFVIMVRSSFRMSGLKKIIRRMNFEIGVLSLIRGCGNFHPAAMWLAKDERNCGHHWQNYPADWNSRTHSRRSQTITVITYAITVMVLWCVTHHHERDCCRPQPRCGCIVRALQTLAVFVSKQFWRHCIFWDKPGQT